MILLNLCDIIERRYIKEKKVYILCTMIDNVGAANVQGSTHLYCWKSMCCRIFRDLLVENAPTYWGVMVRFPACVWLYENNC